MFGYVTLYRKGLADAEMDRYQAYYCGLCRTLGRRYGHTGQLALSYDMAFVAILLTALYDTPTVAGLRRRRLQPARRKGPQYFKPDCGVSQGRNLACMARCSVNSRKVRSSRRFPPVPLRSDRHAPPTYRRATDIPKGAHAPR